MDIPKYGAKIFTLVEVWAILGTLMINADEYMVHFWEDYGAVYNTTLNQVMGFLRFVVATEDSSNSITIKTAHDS